jgi:hypothetical protein
MLLVVLVTPVTREPVPVIPSDRRYGATVVSRRAMPVSSGTHPSAAVTSEREKSSVAYISLAAAPGLVPGSAPGASTVAALGPADAGRTAAPAPSAPIVLAATQVAAASASKGRRLYRDRNVIPLL